MPVFQRLHLQPFGARTRVVSNVGNTPSAPAERHRLNERQQARPRRVDVVAVEPLPGRPHYFNLRLRTQAGTYVKEFVHGDLGRTRPSVGSLLGCRTEILQLDVLEVHIDDWP